MVVSVSTCPHRLQDNTKTKTKEINVKQQVLFICTHNSARSQMAEGLMNALLGDRYEASSAGTEQTRVKPQAIEVLSEIGIDITGHRSKTIDEFQGIQFDVVVTVCDNAQETCPFFPGKKVLHKSFNDPSNTDGSEEEKLEAFRKTRDEIKAWLFDSFSD
jgi:arsenate reductase (thioredoxin)